MAASEAPCLMNEVEPCDCSRWRPGMKTIQRSGTPGGNERRDEYGIGNNYYTSSKCLLYITTEFGGK